MRLLGSSLLLAAVLLASCVAHEKSGDSAAAVGDWRHAVLEYRSAVESSPEDPVLRKKFDEARAHALSSSTQRARLCASQGDFECALDEADFVSGLDPAAGASLGALRADAARQVALLRVRDAQSAIARGDLDRAGAALRAGRELSSAPDVVQAVRRAGASYAASAAAASESLRQARRFPEAVKVLAGAVEFDPALAPRLAALRAEHEAFRTAEHDRLVFEAEGALGQRSWLDAAERLRAAQGFRPDERAGGLERYARAMASGEAAVARADFRGAERAYRQASETGLDRGGLAAAALDAVAIRPLTVRLTSLLVQPFRPDGTPWAGGLSPQLFRLAGAAANASRHDRRSALDRTAEVADLVPPANWPTLVLQVTLPGGRLLETVPQRALACRPGSTVTLATNAYDRRELSVRVVQREPGAPDALVGAVQISLATLASERRAALRDGSIASLELTAGFDAGAVDGATSPDLRTPRPAQPGGPAQPGSPAPVRPAAWPAH